MTRDDPHYDERSMQQPGAGLTVMSRTATLILGAIAVAVILGLVLLSALDGESSPDPSRTESASGLGDRPAAIRDPATGIAMSHRGVEAVGLGELLEPPTLR